MASLKDLDNLVVQLNNRYDELGYLDEDLTDAYVKYATFAIFQLNEYRYGRDLAKSAIDKIEATVKKYGTADLGYAVIFA